MSNKKLGEGNVYVEVCENQYGGLSLCISNDSGGYRMAGGKVGGGETVESWEVNAEELIKVIKQHTAKAKKGPSEALNSGN